MQERCRCTDEARFPLLVMPCQIPTVTASPRRESREVIPPALGHSPKDASLSLGLGRLAAFSPYPIGGRFRVLPPV